MIDIGDIATHSVYAPSPEFLAELDEYTGYVSKLEVPLYAVRIICRDEVVALSDLPILCASADQLPRSAQVS